MEEVKNKIAYYVSRNTNFQVGDIIISDDASSNRNSNRLDVLEKLKSKKAKNTREKNKFYVILAMEDARIEINPELPAKQNSLYVSGSFEENSSEYQRIKMNVKDMQNVSLQNLKLELNGIWHKVACTNESNREKDFDKIKKQMYDYWNGLNGDYYMYLFQGKAKVLEILEEFKS